MVSLVSVGTLELSASLLFTVNTRLFCEHATALSECRLDRGSGFVCWLAVGPSVRLSVCLSVRLTGHNGDRQLQVAFKMNNGKVKPTNKQRKTNKKSGKIMLCCYCNLSSWHLIIINIHCHHRYYCYYYYYLVSVCWKNEDRRKKVKKVWKDYIVNHYYY